VHYHVAGRDGVFVVDETAKKAKFVGVKPGIREGGWVEILEPALTGRVVTIGQHMLNDGTEINVTEDRTGKENGGSGTSPTGADRAGKEGEEKETSGKAEGRDR